MKNDEMIIRETISMNIKKYRELNDNMAIRELGRQSGLEEKQIRRIENCEHTATIKTLVAIANTFDIEVICLLCSRR